MSMTVIVTRNVRPRFRGFLASVMCEVAPGVYTAPRMNPGVRDRVWDVLRRWWRHGEEALVVMTWRDEEVVGGQQVQVLGERRPETHGASAEPLRRELVLRDGVYLARTPLTPAERVRLGIVDPDVPF